MDAHSNSECSVCSMFARRTTPDLIKTLLPSFLTLRLCRSANAFHFYFKQKLINVDVAFSSRNVPSFAHWCTHNRDTKRIAIEIRDAIHMSVCLIVLITLSIWNKAAKIKTKIESNTFICVVFSFSCCFQFVHVDFRLCENAPISNRSCGYFWMADRKPLCESLLSNYTHRKWIKKCWHKNTNTLIHSLTSIVSTISLIWKLLWFAARTSIISIVVGSFDFQ